MILDKEVYLKGNSRNIKHYSDLGYDVRANVLFLVKVEHLTHGSTAEVKCQCDTCGVVKNIAWGTLYKYIKGDVNSKYYCLDCCTIKRIETNLERYGGKSPTSSPDIIKKIQETNIERYGVVCSLSNKEINDKTKQTWIDKYGVDSPSKSDVVKDKIKDTNIKRYGVSSPLQNKEIHDKVSNTNLERYGVKNVFEIDDIKEKIKDQMFDKWGMYYTQTDDFKDKSKKTIIERYGVDKYVDSIPYINSLLENKKYKYTNINFIDYSREERKYSIICNDCNSSFLINSDLLNSRVNSDAPICLICNPIGDKYTSSGENRLAEFIVDNGIDIQKTNMKLIHPYHLDIYIESKNIAIEFNGIYWHCDKFKDKNYHLNKYNRCIEKNTTLFQIWEDDWNNRKDIVKSMLLNKLGLIDNKIYARKCVIKIVKSSDKDEFLNNNHIQGKTTSSINLGLYYNDELVSLMTFGKRRTNNKSEFELIRFCNKLNTSIVGGASKLFKYFINNYEYDNIISYSDNSYSNGDIYNLLNFKYVSTSINYYWCDGKNKYHRFNFNKKRLVKQGFDPNKTEDQIMRERSFVKIWGAGNKKWIYTKNG